MKKQISNVSGHQTSKVFALLYMLFTIPFAIVGILGFMFSSSMEMPNGQVGPQFPWLFFVFAPIIYGAMGYVFTRLGCVAYNFIAKRFGGIEFTVTENERT
ncbi:MAG: hypothetical protein COB33_008885 [Thiotrichaceae bacterium]|nr:hypothetical protein [Thiotrichaceae bacterium]MBL1260629.1 hypothetical protein [Thiotrichaceae bacterium]